MHSLVLAGVVLLAINADTPADPYSWLEEITGARALAYVEAENAITLKRLQSESVYAEIKQQSLAILNSHERIPYVRKLGPWYYNFWQDAANPRGLLRRTTPAEYRKSNPGWETVLDLDALAKAEHENWVWGGSTSLPPDYERSLVSLSRGGSDAKVVREFDLKKKEFVAGGFSLPEAKSETTWRDKNTLYVGTDFGPGSLTDSGYPRIVKRWKRGTPLADAATVFEGQKTDVAAAAWVDHTPGFFREGFNRSIAFYNSETFLLEGGKDVKIDIPNDAESNFFRQWLTVQLRSDWHVGGRTYKAGALLATKLDAFLRGERNFEVLFEPTGRVSLQEVSETHSALVLNLSDNVHSRIIETAPPGSVFTTASIAAPPGAAVIDAAWQTREMKLPGAGSASASGVDPDESNELWVNYQDFLTPSSLYLTHLGDNPGEPIKSLPSFFNAHGMEVRQLEATSADGTRVPYFVVGKTAAIRAGNSPTLLYGYGGFEIPMEPHYAAIAGKAWLERGGVYVLANIRGGGEFGPAWHQAAVKEHRQRAFDDFEAVAADIVKRGITTVPHLGIMGGSNGGLLVATVAIQRPELFGAVVCQVPLTDMRRYNKFLAGASWMAEYGDPDKPEDWAYLSKYSPYQNVRPGQKYPPILFTTSTRDDRVHPAHARKMFAKMKDMGYDVMYYENTEGGHAGSANNEQRAKMTALEYTFLWMKLR
ncbi:MAG TPA: prolyl oligopeptidase family serine peptidase [Pirellulales bacterium]|nr:prolyl oligopeptidase family serine peptidase [Pirellulales bacterium]